jgi:hypothetical protein
MSNSDPPARPLVQFRSIKPFYVEIDELMYQGGGSVAFCRGPLSGSPALPRRVLSVSGLAFPVDSLMSDGRDMCRGNMSLFSICVPSTVVSIGLACFQYCRALSLVAFESGSQLSLIGPRVFYDCRSLKSIYVSSGVRTLGECSFFECAHLACVAFDYHSQLSRIDAWTFSHCAQLRSICLPAGLEHVGHSALPWQSLECLRFETGNRHFSVSESAFLVYEGISIVGPVGAVTELAIESDIEELCDRCFAYQSSLSSVSFAPNSRLRRIGDFAFAYSSLSSIVIPSRVEMIGANCFLGCAKLSIVQFESNSRLSAIGRHAFGLCPLVTVWVPSCIEAIALDHFGYCPKVRIMETVIMETGEVVRAHPRPLVRDGIDWLLATEC